MSIPFGRIGSKRRIVDKILNYFPKNYEDMTYVEVFLGSGAIFFGKNVSKKEIINDLDKDLMDAYENIMKIETIPNSYPEYEHINSNKDLTLFYKSKGENPFQQFIKDLVKYCATFACKGFGNAYMDKKPSLVKCKFIEKYQQRLKDAIITSKDYKEILQEYDDEKTLFYLDPPYESCKQLYHNETMDMVELRDILKNIKGKFILSLNDSSNIRTLFQDFVIIDFIQKSVNNKDIGTKARKEVIILNFFFL